MLVIGTKSSLSRIIYKKKRICLERYAPTLTWRQYLTLRTSNVQHRGSYPLSQDDQVSLIACSIESVSIKGKAPKPK